MVRHGLFHVGYPDADGRSWNTCLRFDRRLYDHRLRRYGFRTKPSGGVFVWWSLGRPNGTPFYYPDRTTGEWVVGRRSGHFDFFWCSCVATSIRSFNDSRCDVCFYDASPPGCYTVPRKETSIS